MSAITVDLLGPQPVSVAHTEDKAGGQQSDRPPAQPGGSAQPETPGQPGRRGLPALAALVINFVVPLLAYELLKSHVSHSATALILAGAIPVAYTLVVLAVTRKLDPIGVVSVVTFGFGVLLSWASGGSALALELQDPALTGLIGIACLASVALGRPLHPIILRWLGRNNARYSDIASRTQKKTSMMTTAVIGVAFTVHAAAVAILALTQSTSTFVAWQNLVGLPPVAIGIGGLFFYRSRLEARKRAAADAAAHDDQATATDGQSGEQA